MFELIRLVALCLSALPLVLAATKLSAIGIPVSNLTRSTAFYSTTLGLRAYRTISISEYEETIMTLASGGVNQTALVIMQYKKPKDLSNLAGKLVFGVDDVAATVNALEKAGGTVVNPLGTLKVGGQVLPIAFVKDPDGHTIELNPLGMKF